jgi:hypothetical protein
MILRQETVALSVCLTIRWVMNGLFDQRGGVREPGYAFGVHFSRSRHSQAGHLKKQPSVCLKEKAFDLLLQRHHFGIDKVCRFQLC